VLRRQAGRHKMRREQSAGATEAGVAQHACFLLLAWQQKVWWEAMGYGRVCVQRHACLQVDLVGRGRQRITEAPQSQPTEEEVVGVRLYVLCEGEVGRRGGRVRWRRYRRRWGRKARRRGEVGRKRRAVGQVWQCACVLPSIGGVCVGWCRGCEVKGV